MVDMSYLSTVPEGREMVRRDPGLRDSFPELKKNDVATDRDRELHGIPASCRIEVPLCLSAEELHDWADELAGLAHQIKGAAMSKHTREIHRLTDIKALCKGFSNRYKPQIDAANARKWDRKSAQTEGEQRYGQAVEDAFIARATNNVDNSN